MKKIIVLAAALVCLPAWADTLQGYVNNNPAEAGKYFYTFDRKDGFGWATKYTTSGRPVAKVWFTPTYTQKLNYLMTNSFLPEEPKIQWISADDEAAIRGAGATIPRGTSPKEPPRFHLCGY